MSMLKAKPETEREREFVVDFWWLRHDIKKALKYCEPCTSAAFIFLFSKNLFYFKSRGK
jgi:hypothetical protein